MNYAEALDWLDAAHTLQAKSITVEINEGTFTVPLEEAAEAWEELAPGEPFNIISINY
jgi:hypothetical protein